MTPAIQDTLLQLFEHVRQDIDILPAVPVDDWQEGSVERRLLTGFRDMLEQVQQRMLQFKQTEEQLREKEEQYRSVFEAVTDSLTISRLENGQVVEVNPAACKMLGYSYKELIGMLPADLVPPDYLPVVTEGLQTLKAGGRNDLVMMTLRKDGTTFLNEVHSTQFTFKGMPHLLTVARDITERIEAEKQVREREEQYRSVFEATYDGLVIRDMDGFYVEVNPAFCSMFGYTREELIGLHISVLTPPESLPIVDELLETLKAEGTTFEKIVQARRKDGTVFYVDAHSTTFTYRGKPHSLGVIRDISERIEAEERLREREEQYRSVFEATSDGLIIRNMDGYVVEANPTACSMHGYTYAEFIGLHRTDIIDPKDRTMVAEYMKAIQAGRSFLGQAVDLRKDGSAFPVEVRGSTFIYLGKPHTLSVLRDITERVEAEKQLLEKEEQYRSIFEASTDGLLIIDLENSHSVEVNPMACQMWGYTHEEMLGRPIGISDDTQHIPVHALEVVRAGGQFQMRDTTTRKDGTSFNVEVHATPFTYRGKPHLLAIVRDITEQVQAQQLLEQRVEERTRELSSLLEISHTVASTLHLKPLVGLILDQLKMVVDYTGSAILTVEGKELVFLDSRSPTLGEQLLQVRFPLKNLRLIWKAITARETIIMQDVREETPLARAFRVAMGELGETAFHYVRACMFVPLTLRERVIGMLVLTSSEPQAFTQHHATLALAIANQAAIAIENARLYAKAQELAAVEERQRLARELHDSVSQALYGISLGVHTARMQMERDPKELTESLDYVLELAEAALIEMRALIFELRPESLEVEGLVTALSKQAAALRARQGINVQLNLGQEPEVPLKVKQDLYRIAQEALHNTVKHARASQVELRLDQIDNVVILEVCDNGRGFDSTGSFPGHLGLRSMRERAINLGGTLEIESTEGQGTAICIRIPG
jgi:PAS domain S-box-containing protein